MGNHPDLYPQLSINPSLIGQIKKSENEISRHPFYCIPKNDIMNHESEMNEGDIIALTTRISGLDVSHLGLVSKKNGIVFLLHASSTAAKVELSRLPLNEYLQGLKNVTGIIVVRAN